MLNSINNNSSYLNALELLAANKSQNAGKTTVSGLSATARIKEAIALAILRGGKEAGASAVETEPNEAYAEDERLTKVNTFDDNMSVWVCEDDSSTEGKPVMYVEAEIDGEKRAYLVDVASVDVDDMTKVEAFALMKYMGKTEGWSDPTYADMINALASLINKGKDEEEEEKTTDPISLLEQFNKYYKSKSTYDSSGKYGDTSGYVSFFEQNRALRGAERTYQIQSVLQKIVVDENGKRTLASGIYM